MTNIHYNAKKMLEENAEEAKEAMAVHGQDQLEFILNQQKTKTCCEACVHYGNILDEKVLGPVFIHKYEKAQMNQILDAVIAFQDMGQIIEKHFQKEYSSKLAPAVRDDENTGRDSGHVVKQMNAGELIVTTSANLLQLAVEKKAKQEIANRFKHERVSDHASVNSGS